MSSAECTLLLLEEDLVEVTSFEVAGGTGCVFTSRCPGKASPNEDAAGVVSLGGAGGMLIVADGMGGRPGGEQASGVAVKRLAGAALENADAEPEPRVGILNGIEAANEVIQQMGIGAGTALAVLEIHGRRVRPYHVGDCEILVVGQRGRIKLQTVAHSPVGYAVESGLIEREDAIHHVDRHYISNIVGSPEMRIEVGAAIELADHDSVLLASDGLFDNMSEDEIVDIVRAGPMEEAARILAETCRRRMNEPRDGEPSKPDDLTFILFRPGPQSRVDLAESSFEGA